MFKDQHNTNNNNANKSYWGMLWCRDTSHFHTEKPHNITVAAVCQFSALGCSHKAEQRWRKEEPLCNSHIKPALWLLKQRDGTHHDDDVYVFIKGFPRCPPVNLNMYMLNVYNHMDDVIMCSDWDPDPANILESEEVTFLL